MSGSGSSAAGGLAGNTTGVHPFYDCHEVSVFCPVAATTLGYYPNRGINIFFAIGFGLAGLTTFVLGTWKRTWSYMSFITAGCMLETAGYAARVFLASNPWDQQAFETQICAIILAPTLVCISVYLTLKHVCLSLSPALSRVRPALYPFVFVPADVSCLLLQAIGGALAASAGYKNQKLLSGGNRTIIAGITLQVVVLGCFGAASVDYYLRVRRWIRGGGGVDVGSGVGAADARTLALWRDRKFRMFVGAVAVAFSGILIRCIYRIAEMAGGWGNRIMQDQPSFIVLEGFMVLIPVWLLAAFSPGLLFPDMARRMGMTRAERRKEEAAAAAASASSTAGDGETGKVEGGGKKGVSAAAAAPATSHGGDGAEVEKGEGETSRPASDHSNLKA